MEPHFENWEDSVLYDTKKDVLRTLMYIHENKMRDCGKALSSQQLDDVKDAVCILHMIFEMSEDAEHEDEHHHPATHAHPAKPTA